VALLDVNALVALAWDAHVHHVSAADWFDRHAGPWATCPMTEAGFVRVSSNARAVPGALTASEARRVLKELRCVGEHRFLTNDVSLTDDDVPPVSGYRQVTDAVLLTVARRAGVRLVTFDRAMLSLTDASDVELLER
jgi:uncharacterized protein